MEEKIDLRPKVLEIIKEKGPVIPRDLVRELGGDTFIMGAVLTKLKEEGRIKISNTKIGGSPTYYISGQEEKLQDVAKYLNEKDNRAYELLKEKKIVRDKEQTPLMRVALRTIKDYAKPLEVNIRDEREIFWKWYLLPNEDAKQKIRSLLGITAKKTKEKIQKETDTKEFTQSSKPASANILEQEKTEELKKVDDTPNFWDDIKSFFDKNNIEIVEETTVKKKKEYEFIVSMPTPVGTTRYYTRAKQKKKVSEGDLSTAYVKAQSKKLPLLFLTDGQLTKKAQEMIDDGELDNITLKLI